MKPIISPTITTCKGSRGGCSDEALEEIKAVHAAREQQNLSSQPIPMNEPAQPAPVGKPLRYLSVCSGMEAASVAWHPLGWTPVGFSEIEPFPCAILKHRFPNTPNYGSLTEYQSWPLSIGDVDLLVGGCPCQSFSVAGLRRGMQDPRGNLTLTYLGLVDKLRPKWVVYENVPGLLSSNGGRDFGSFLGALGQLGYGWAYRVLDAQYVGRCEMHPQGRGWDAVPQRRRRIFVVACLGDWRAPAEVLSLREGLRGYLEAGGKKRKGAAADAGSGVEASGLHRTVGTLCADTHPGAYSGQDAYTGRLIPDQKPVVIDRAAFNQGVNAQYDPHIAESEVMDSLVARGPHAVGQPITQSDVAGPLDAHYYKGPGSRQGGEREYVAQPIAIQGTIIGRGENAGPQGTGATEGGPMFTLTKTDVHGVAHTIHCSDIAPTVTSSGPPYSRTGNERVEAEALVTQQIYENSRRDALRIYEGVSPTLQSFMGTGGCNVPMVQPIAFDTYNQTTSNTTQSVRSAASDVDHVGAVFTQAMAVRRLTPNECYRLQGFPDNWGRIPWKGKPAEECPDGPQYKAAGNSMAVPCMFWIGQRIAAVEASPHA